MKRLLVFGIWLPTTLLALTSTVLFYAYRNQILQQKDKLNLLNHYGSYRMYASTPKTLGAATTAIKTEDAIPELVYQYLENYKSPMVDTSAQFVNIFRSYHINPIIPLAIAQCESNLGKKMPKVSEESEDICLNPFGLGIHSRGKLCFESWEESYEKMAQILKADYIDQGYTDIKEIMAKYCPLSIENGGSWAKCVEQFTSDIETLTIQQH